VKYTQVILRKSETHFALKAARCIHKNLKHELVNRWRGEAGKQGSSEWSRKLAKPL